MILKAITRGNGRKYAQYLEKSKKNERVQVLEISGTTAPHSLSDSLFEMSVFEEKTRSNLPILEIIINPAAGEGHMMTKEKWLRSMDIIERNIEFNGQPRAGVEQVYKDEPHVHALWSRYDPKTGTMLPIDHIAHKLKAARIEIENEFGHTHLLSWQEKKALEKQQALEKEQKLADEKKKEQNIKSLFAENSDDIAPRRKKPSELLAEAEAQRQDLDNGMSIAM